MPEKKRHMFCKQSAMNPSMLLCSLTRASLIGAPMSCSVAIIPVIMLYLISTDISLRSRSLRSK